MRVSLYKLPQNFCRPLMVHPGWFILHSPHHEVGENCHIKGSACQYGEQLSFPDAASVKKIVKNCSHVKLSRELAYYPKG